MSRRLPARTLTGYLHTSFVTGPGRTRLGAVPPEWDVVNLSFGEPTTATSGEIRLRSLDDDLVRSVAVRRDRGGTVLLSIGGDAEIRLETAAARRAFVRSVSALIDRIGLDGVDVDLEGRSLWLEPGDDDFRRPTTPVVTHLIAALRELKDRYGDDFVLTTAPETFFVQVGYVCYGAAPWGRDDPRAGVYLPVLHALRDELSLVHVQHFNSGPVVGLDDAWHTPGTAGFHVALADMLLSGFPVAGGEVFAPLRSDQVGLGVSLDPDGGAGQRPDDGVRTALDALVRGFRVDGYRPRRGHGRGPRGLMVWSIDWQRASAPGLHREYRSVLDDLDRRVTR